MAACINFVQIVYDNFDKGETVAAFFFDLKAVFDVKNRKFLGGDKGGEL